MIHTSIRFTKSSLIFLSVAFFGMQFSACRGNHNNEPDPKPEEFGSQSSAYETLVEIGANIQQSSEAKNGPHRVHLGAHNVDGRTDILWSEGDMVACWNAEEKLWSPYTLIGGANTTSARFQGKAVNAADDEAGVGKPAMNISHAIYPLEATVRTGEGDKEQLISPGLNVHSIYFTMPSTQVYQAPVDSNPTFMGKYDVMTGSRNESDKNHVMFTSTGGVLLLRIKGSELLNRVYKMKLTSNRDEKLWGTFSAAIGSYGAATVEVANDINGASLSDYGCVAGTNSLILDCSEAFGSNNTLPTDAFTYFYFVVPYGVFSEGFEISLDTNGDDVFGDATIVTRKDNTIRQADIKMMPALELTENVTLTWDLDDLYNQGTVTEF